MKKKEIEKLQEKEKQLYAQFQASLGDNNKFADYLTKVFKKKIKRAKKKVTDGEGKCIRTGPISCYLSLFIKLMKKIFLMEKILPLSFKTKYHDFVKKN